MNELIVKMPAIEEVLRRLTIIEQRLDKVSKPDGNHWLTTKEAASALGISIRSLQEKRNRCEIPFSQFGAKIRYRNEDIEMYLMNHYIKSSYQKRS